VIKDPNALKAKLDNLFGGKPLAQATTNQNGKCPPAPSWVTPFPTLIPTITLTPTMTPEPGATPGS
jgi:hypothetical protein